MTQTGNKRYICSFVKEIDGELKPNVVVIAAPNNIIAAAKLCEKYGVVNHEIPTELRRNNGEAGIKTIRLSETNTYEGETEDERFSDSPET